MKIIKSIIILTVVTVFMATTYAAEMPRESGTMLCNK